MPLGIETRVRGLRKPFISLRATQVRQRWSLSSCPLTVLVSLLAAVVVTSPLGVPPALPPGWQAKLTREGRLFYVNHATQVRTQQERLCSRAFVQTASFSFFLSFCFPVFTLV